MRIGLFGGSFNPPHLGHLALARQALQQLELDELRGLPAGQPWQKPAHAMAPAVHRVAMLRLLLEGEPGCVVDARETLRQGPSYTIDTLREIHAEQPEAELFLIVGQDQYAHIDTWHQAAQIAELARLAVAARAGVAPAPPAAWRAWAARRQISLALPRIDISASQIRQRIAQGLPVDALAGPAVARYIDQHHLYRISTG